LTSNGNLSSNDAETAKVLECWNKIPKKGLTRVKKVLESLSYELFSEVCLLLGIDVFEN